MEVQFWQSMFSIRKHNQHKTAVMVYVRDLYTEQEWKLVTNHVMGIRGYDRIYITNNVFFWAHLKLSEIYLQANAIEENHEPVDSRGTGWHHPYFQDTNLHVVGRWFSDVGHKYDGLCVSLCGVYPPVIKHGNCKFPLYKWRFQRENHLSMADFQLPCLLTRGWLFFFGGVGVARHAST